MSLEQQLTDAMRRVRAGLLNNEAQVKQSVILPILRALGWNTDAPEQLGAEYQAGNGRVDYALLHYGQPRVFIEAKRIGSAEERKAQEQLFGYAADRGIPILVLTDGNRWDFYFGMGSGVWEDRCFCRLALDDDQNIPKYAEFLTAHLGRRAVISGDARRSADLLLERNQALDRARRTLPDAWRALLTEPHQELCKLLGARVEARCGVKPRTDDILSFLKEVAIGPPQRRSLSTASAGDSPTLKRPHTTRREIAEAVGSDNISGEDGPTHGPPPSEDSPRPPKSLQGRKTPQRDFARPILQALIELGGGGKRRQVLAGLERIMEPRLGDFDRETHKDGTVRWEKTAEFQCTLMRKQGLLKPVAKLGWWEVTDKGRTHALGA